LAWQAYSADSALWWNITKCSLISLPALLWGFVWTVLRQLREAPTLAASLVARDDGVMSRFSDSDLPDKSGISGLFNTLKAFREESGVWIVLDTIGNVTLLGNPLFIALCFVMAGLLFLFFLIAILLLII
jgi:hypothetical protein